MDGSKSTEATLTELRRAPHGVLAFDTDTGPAGTPGLIPVTVYLAGSFLFTTESLADDGFINKLYFAASPAWARRLDLPVPVS